MHPGWNACGVPSVSSGPGKHSSIRSTGNADVWGSIPAQDTVRADQEPANGTIMATFARRGAREECRHAVTFGAHDRQQQTEFLRRRVRVFRVVDHGAPVPGCGQAYERAASGDRFARSCAARVVPGDVVSLVLAITGGAREPANVHQRCSRSIRFSSSARSRSQSAWTTS